MDFMVKLGRDRLKRMAPAEISELMAETLPTLNAAQWQAVLDRVLAETRRRAPGGFRALRGAPPAVGARQ